MTMLHFASPPLLSIQACTEESQFLQQQLSNNFNIPLSSSLEDTTSFVLAYRDTYLELHNTLEKKQKPLLIDFTAGKLAYRRQTAGKQQELAKAVGVKAHYKPKVLDTTAGLGRDAFVLASLGCTVHMLERSAALAALLDDALQRLAADKEQQAGIKLSLQWINAINYLQSLAYADYPEVIYIDPMFPERQKTALVKKEMRILRELIGDDEDAENLLTLALSRAQQRIVVKRHRLAPYLMAKKPHFQIVGKSTRFDIYLPIVHSP